MSRLIKSKLLQLFRIKNKYIECKITDNDFIIDFKRFFFRYKILVRVLLTLTLILYLGRYRRVYSIRGDPHIISACYFIIFFQT